MSAILCLERDCTPLTSWSVSLYYPTIYGSNTTPTKLNYSIHFTNLAWVYRNLTKPRKMWRNAYLSLKNRPLNRKVSLRAYMLTWMASIRHLRRVRLSRNVWTARWGSKRRTSSTKANRRCFSGKTFMRRPAREMNLITWCLCKKTRSSNWKS